MSDLGRTQIPIVCPGHTRPLAELQYLWNEEEKRTFLLSACHDKMPMLRDGTSGDWIGTFQGHKGAVWSMQMDNTGNLAATASGDYSARVWDAITGNSLLELPHKHIVKTCMFSPDSKLLATGGKEGLLRIYDLMVCIMNKPLKAEVAVELKQDSPINKVVWVTNTLILCACADGKIYLWDRSSPEAPVHTFDTPQGDEIRDLELRTVSSGMQIMTAAAGTKVFFYDMQSKKLLKEYTMPIHFREEGGATLHPSGLKFVAGGSDLWVRVFDFQTGKELECHKGHHGPIRCVRYAPDGALYATGSEDGTIRLWKTDPVAQ